MGNRLGFQDIMGMYKYSHTPNLVEISKVVPEIRISHKCGKCHAHCPIFTALQKKPLPTNLVGKCNAFSTSSVYSVSYHTFSSFQQNCYMESGRGFN